MDFSKAFKVFQLNVLRQVGVAVTPQQVGLKSDPIADLQAKNTVAGFSGVLNQLGAGGLQGLTAPVPPTPPANASDTAAQAKYQQDLLTYQNNFQLYNQRFMQLFLSQLQSLQQSISASAQQSAKSSPSSASAGGTSGIGGILSGTADL